MIGSCVRSHRRDGDPQRRARDAELVEALPHVEQVARRAAGAALGRRVEHEVDRVGRLEDPHRQQHRGLLEHDRRVDLELGPDVARLISRAKRSMSERWFGKKTCSPAMKKLSSPMFSEHISGASSTVVSRSSTASRGDAAGRELDDRVGLGAQAPVQLVVDAAIHRVGAVGRARMDVQHGGARPPGGDALLDDLVGLLGKVRVGLLAVDAARQRAGDDQRLGAGPPRARRTPGSGVPELLGGVGARSSIGAGIRSGRSSPKSSDEQTITVRIARKVVQFRLSIRPSDCFGTLEGCDAR